MKRWAWRLLAGVALVAAVGLLWPRAPAPDSRSVGGSTPARGGHPGRAASRVAPEAVAASEAWPRGAHAIRGVVLSLLGQPVPGASLVALPFSESDLVEAPPNCSHGRSDEVPTKPSDCVARAVRLQETLEAPRGEEPELLRATSDARGHFELTGLSEGIYEVWVAAPHGAAVRKLMAGEEDVHVTLEAGLHVNGVVRDEERRATAGARVTVLSRAFVRRFEQVTGPDGRFDFGTLPELHYQVHASKEGLLPDLSAQEPGDDVASALELRVPHALSGRVVRAGQGVAGAEVYTVSEGGRVSRTTDARGHFTFEDLPQGRYPLEARVGQSIAMATESLYEEAEPVVLELQSCVEVVGQVTSVARRPIAGAKVRFSGSGLRLPEPVETDARGEYRLDCLAPGAFVVKVDAAGFIAREAEVPAAGETRRLDWVLSEAAAFQGQIVDEEGRGIPGARILMAQERFHAEPPQYFYFEGVPQELGLSDEEGHFSIDALMEGHYLLDIKGPEGFEAWPEERMRVPLTGARYVLKRSAPRPGVVAGTVVDERGEPLEGLYVQATLLGSDVEAPLLTRTNAVGQFRLRGLPVGRWRVAAMHEQPEEDRVQVHAAREVEVSGPEPVLLELALGSGLTLAGRVVDEAGSPALLAYIRVLRELPGQRPRVVGEMRVDARGRFALEHLEPGALQLDVRPTVGRAILGPSEHEALGLDEEELAPPASFRSLRRTRLTVRAGDTDVRIVLQPKPEVRGRVVREDGTPVTDFILNHHPVTDDQGRFAEEVEPSVPQRFLFVAKGLAPLLREVEPATDADIVLPDTVMRRGRSVRGRVLDAVTGKPLKARVELFPRLGPPVDASGRRDAPALSVWSKEEDGSFELPAVESGMAVGALCPGYESFERLPIPEGSGELVIRLVP